MNRVNLLVLSILIFSAIIAAPTSFAHLTSEVFQSDAPFSIDIKPEKITIKPGDEISLSVKIEAVEGFTGSIDIELDVSTLGYSATFDLGKLDPPFPKEHEFTVNIPSEIPAGKVQGTLRGTSGEHVVEEDVEITIQGAGGVLGAILRALSNLWKWILRLLGIK